MCWPQLSEFILAASTLPLAPIFIECVRSFFFLVSRKRRWWWWWCYCAVFVWDLTEEITITHTHRQTHGTNKIAKHNRTGATRDKLKIRRHRRCRYATTTPTISPPPPRCALLDIIRAICFDTTAPRRLTLIIKWAHSKGVGEWGRRSPETRPRAETHTHIRVCRTKYKNK